MEEQPKLLEVGMFVFDYGNWSGLYRYEVTRVTPKQAFAGSLTVKREIKYEKEWHEEKIRPKVKKVGSYGNAYVETTELLTEWREQNLISKAKRLHRDFKINDIDKNQAKKIIELYESFTPKEVTPK